jgi:hypothetical protein
MRPLPTPIGREALSERPALDDYPLVSTSAHRSPSVAARRTPAHDARTSGESRVFTSAEAHRPTVIGYVALAPCDIDVFAPARGIGAWCEANGWPLAKVLHDVRRDTPAHARRGLAQALEEVHAGRAAGLVLARLRDLADTAAELGPLLRRFAAGDAFVIALDYELEAPRPVAAQRSGGLSSGTAIPRPPADGRR